MKEKEKRGKNDISVLIELYKVAEENHRFYISKRFMIISLYFPFISLILTSIYFFIRSDLRFLISILGIILTWFLYSLENRNWILSNICLEMSKKLGANISSEYNLHLKLINSFKNPLPISRTFIDGVIRKISNSQHKTILVLTIFLIIYWLALLVVPFFITI